MAITGIFWAIFITGFENVQRLDNFYIYRLFMSHGASKGIETNFGLSEDAFLC